MDINDFRGVMSAVILVAFIGLILFTLMGGRDRFRDAADAPFADDEDDACPGATNARPEQDDQAPRDRTTRPRAESEGPGR